MFIKKRWLIGLVVAFTLQNAHAANLTRTDVEVAPTREQVVFYFDRAVEPSKSFTLSNPPRVVIDFPALQSGAGAGLSPSYPGQFIRSIRFGRPSPDVSRVVIDTTQPPLSHSVAATANPPQITITMQKPIVAPTASAPVVPDKPAPILTMPPKSAFATPPVTKPATKPAPTPLPKPMDAAREAAKPTIAIDAGHGGKDTGAIGIHGMYEKIITLRYAQALQHALLKTGRYRVVLTRSDDTYLFLKDRVEIARKAKSNLFISLHADSNPNKSAQGLSIYTISEDASDAEAEALAAQENKSDVIGGIDLSVEDETVANILIDLAARETRNKASVLADTIIENMHPKIPLLRNTHRFAGFRVLKAPDIPSVLIEIGFLSNAMDEKRIQSREYQDKVIRSLVQGIDAYYGG